MKPIPRKPILAAAIALWALAPGGAEAQDSTMQHQALPPMEVKVPRYHNPLRSYRATANRVNDLVSTRLELRFDFSRKYLYGKAWITLQPHFYPTDSLCLDARGMDIHSVDLSAGGRRQRLSYRYDGQLLRIRLDRPRRRAEAYTVVIDYTARPDELKDPGGSSAIASDKGLYFINADGKDPYQPTEVWTQGETQSNSVWFPTIDRPNQKTLMQISMTVPQAFTTLSNGRLLSRHANGDGTRTDTWKMDHPHAPYLTMLAAGPFVVIKDHWKDVPVEYYVEKAYAPYARAIFGATPDMIDFYSRILGVPFPWSKYAQIVARDFVSGAMENTTATLHGEFMYQTSRQLADDNYRNESVIAHELFHQWFGDLVTTESWSNLTLNESFADFSESLWAEHCYGRDFADQHSYGDLQAYIDFAAAGKDHPLVNFYYDQREDVFDRVTYQKGGCVLRMLRNVVGDSAFFDALHLYLTQHAFQAAEAQQLRLAFEEVTGQDLNWFWNQWYYGKGYPKLDISYAYDDALHIARVMVEQTQSGQLFRLPFAIDIYAGGRTERHMVTMMDRRDTFAFHYTRRPQLINVDGDKVLLAEKTDHKTTAEYIYQYHHAPRFLDRLEAIEACAAAQDSSAAARQLLVDALHDAFQGLRASAAQALHLGNDSVRRLAEPVLMTLLKKDPYASVRKAALSSLAGQLPFTETRPLLLAALQDSSLQVENAALGALMKEDMAAAYAEAKKLEATAEAPLDATISAIFAQQGKPEDFPFVEKCFRSRGSFAKLGALDPYLRMLGSVVTDSGKVSLGLQLLERYSRGLAPQYLNYLMVPLKTFIDDKRQAAAMAGREDLKAALTAQAVQGQQLLDRFGERAGH